MSLDETLDRLKAEREARENEALRKAEEELQEAARYRRRLLNTPYHSAPTYTSARNADL